MTMIRALTLSMLSVTQVTSTLHIKENIVAVVLRYMVHVEVYRTWKISL